MSQEKRTMLMGILAKIAGEGAAVEPDEGKNGALGAPLEEALADLAATKAQLDAVTKQAESLRSELESANAQLEKLESQARLKKLQALLGDERGEAAFKSAGSLDNTAFNGLITAMEAAADVEKSSPLFSEMGARGEKAPEVEANGTTRILVAKYGQDAQKGK